MKNYARLKALQDKFDGYELLQHVNVPSAPVVLTIVGVLGVMTIILPVAAIASWIIYPKRKKKAKETNERIDRENERISARLDEIVNEASALSKESAAV